MPSINKNIVETKAEYWMSRSIRGVRVRATHEKRVFSQRQVLICGLFASHPFVNGQLAVL